MRLEIAHQPRDLREMRAIERVRRADRQPDAVQAQRIVARAPARARRRQRAAAREIVFAVRFEPADARAARDDLFVMSRAQPDAGAQPPVAPHRGAGTPRSGANRGEGCAGAHERASYVFAVERAADEALAGALRQLDPFLRVAVLLALALAGVRGARAIVLAGLRHAVALLGGVAPSPSSAANAGPANATRPPMAAARIAVFVFIE